MRQIVVLAAAVVVVSCLASRASAEGIAMQGETCSDTNDCFDGKACLGGRCCTFSQQQYEDTDNWWGWQRFCTSCADTSVAVPGRCEQCTSGYGILERYSTVQADGTLVSDSSLGIDDQCYKECSADEYLDGMSGGLLQCQSKVAAGGYCQGNTNDDRDQFCLSGLCSGVYCCSQACLLYTSPSPRDAHESRMPSSA